MTCHNRLLSEEDTECPDDKFIVHVVTVVLVWPELVGDEMNYELVILITFMYSLSVPCHANFFLYFKLLKPSKYLMS